jgi:integrase
MKEVLAEYADKHIKEPNMAVDLSSEILFTVFMDEWLENLKFSIAPTTYEGYRLILDKHITPHFEPQKIKVKDLTSAHIQHYVKTKMKTLSPNTVIKHLRNISKCLDGAIKQKLIMFNPVKGIDMPKKVKYTDAKHYNEKEIELLLKCSVGDPLEMVILLTVFYGLRRSEVLGLKYNAIDFENKTLEIKHTVTQFNSKSVHRLDATKNDSSCAVVPLPNLVLEKLKNWETQQTQYKLLQPNNYVDEGYVCTLPDGNLIRPNFISQHFKLLLAKNNLRHIRFHDLRHSSASYLKYLGFDLKDIQTWLRHSDIQTSMNLYTHLDMEAKSGIADKLDARIANMGLQ